jgi:hypothetical protein
VVRWLMGLEVLPPARDAVVFQVSPLPETVHEVAFWMVQTILVVADHLFSFFL